MCPLRVVLIFLSATLAGFFVLRRLKTQPDLLSSDDEAAIDVLKEGVEPLPLSTKVRSAMCSGFWTCVDMASGRYLWQNLIGGDDNKKHAVIRA